MTTSCVAAKAVCDDWQGGKFLRRWARILLRPEIRQVEAACDALEQVLLGRRDEAPLPQEPQIRGALLSGCPALPWSPTERGHAAAAGGGLAAMD